GPDARGTVNDFRCMGRGMAAGDIGFGEGFMAGDWDAPDLSPAMESGGRDVGFAEFAAREGGARVTGVPVSRQQYDFAKKRMFENGLAEKADIRLIDYRDVEGRFDRIASIEMFEAVGERYWPAYFDKIRIALAPGGQAG